MTSLALLRPGYATSTRRPGRSVADIASDVRYVRDVLDALDVPWFVTVGWSGGGPHAHAAAHLLGDRCRAVATLAGVGPFGAATRGEADVRAWLGQHAAIFRSAMGPEFADASAKQYH